MRSMNWERGPGEVGKFVSTAAVKLLADVVRNEELRFDRVGRGPAAREESRSERRCLWASLHNDAVRVASRLEGLYILYSKSSTAVVCESVMTRTPPSLNFGLRRVVLKVFLLISVSFLVS